jgi:pimeloyl-ACP methyl ester carboxylesterase
MHSTPQRAGRSDRGCVFVCIHGIGGARSDWLPVAPALARLGEVICAEVPDGALESARDRILADLPDRRGRTVLIGHSRGGLLALMAAARHPDLVDGVVLSGGYVPPNRGGRPWVIGVGSWVKHRVRLVHRFVRAGHLTARQADRSASFLTSLPAVLQMAGIGLRPSTFDSVARSVRCPVLAIAGERDSHVPASWVSAAARRHGWSLVSIPGGSHFAHADNSQLWVAAVEGWLDR